MTHLSSKRKSTNSAFLEHINSVDPAIWCTVEDNKENGAIPFLDMIVKQEAVNTLCITVYRKPTHMDQYWQWDSHHHLSTNYSVINTLTHRARTVCNKPELLQKELDHLRKALSHSMYLKWAIDRMERRFSQLTSEESNNANTQDTAGTKPTSTEAKTKGNIVITYTRGLCKSIKKTCSKYGKQTHFRGNSTIKTPWFTLRIRTTWKTKMESSIGSNVENLHVMKKYRGDL